jgi:hypothetical protein
MRINIFRNRLFHFGIVLLAVLRKTSIKQRGILRTSVMPPDLRLMLAEVYVLIGDT